MDLEYPRQLGILPKSSPTHFGYDVAPIIKLSSFIRNEAHRIGLGEVPTPLSQYINHMQDGGNKLRDKFGNNYLAEKAIERIATYRREKQGYAENGTMLPGRRAYIIDSIKNLEELEILRQIYRETLCVVGVFAPDAMRKTRLVYGGADENEVRNVLDRDLHEVATFGQNTRKIFVQSDFFICNDKKLDELKRRLHRYMEIIFDTNIRLRRGQNAGRNRRQCFSPRSRQ